MKCVNRSSKDFKFLAQHYDVSVGTLEYITHKYWQETGSEDYFPEVLAEAVPVLSAEDCAGIVETLRYYHYSGEEVSPEDEEKVRGLYSTASKYLYEHTAWYKKPYFRFIKALC